MARTFRIISGTVGKAGQQFGPDVQRVKQLLALNGLKVTNDDRWDWTAQRALLDFRQRVFGETPFAMVEDTDPNEPNRPSITPRDMVLFELAYRANVLIRLCPPRSGADAVNDVHDWLVGHETHFAAGRVVWGLDRLPNWAVVTSMRIWKPLSQQFYGFEFKIGGPLALDCTLYANLMMSVWLSGGVHKPPFTAGIGDSGDDHHLAVERYGYRLIGKYSSVSDITEHTAKYPNRLFCIEVGDDVSHMALLLNNQVLQCNIKPPGCTRTTLEHFFKYPHHDKGWISGPAPARP
jgi:hypothetical protein